MDVDRVRRRYRLLAPFYDRLIAPATERLRRVAVERLALHPGERALDLGCGTGLSLPLLRAAVGEGGFVYGADASPDMLARARGRAAAGAWRNVQLIETDAEVLELPEPIDAILCFFTHDVLLSPTALPRAARFLRTGARVCAAGVKLVRGRRGWLLNPITSAYSLPAVTNWDRARSYEPYATLHALLPS